MDALPPGVDLSQIPIAPNPSGAPPTLTAAQTWHPPSWPPVSHAAMGEADWTETKDCCLLGEVAGIAYWFVLYELQVKYGTAKHPWDIAASTITPTVMKGQAAAQVLTSIANPLVKASILLFLVRLFGTLRWVRIFCYTLLVVTVGLYGAYMIALLSLCIPSGGAQWDAALLARCGKTTPATLTIGVCAVVIDAAMFVMPFFIVAKLHVQPSRKRGLAAVFLVGFLTVVSSIVGLAFRIIVSYDSTDSTWDGSKVSITAYTEIFGTVMVSCGPALSSFWFGIFVKSSLYSSLRSRLSRSRLHGHSTPSTLAGGHESGPTKGLPAEDEYNSSAGQGHEKSAGAPPQALVHFHSPP
ncbi:hypothetical protein PG993_007936 [Apiospora rasikravindrae]|uniref:Rhodopsin domain-containing protein n=1 Tax=Apiospora rasikravindrae TaxID=990691 RepID=A0ABR1SYW8_9PEZI